MHLILNIAFYLIGTFLRGELILHARGKYTHPALIEAKPLSERTTLELYEVTLLPCEKAGGKWKASLTTTEGISLRDISGLISGSIVHKPCPCISIDNRVVNEQRQSRSVTHGSPPLINRLHDLQVQGIHVKTLDGLISTEALGKMARPPLGSSFSGCWG